MISQVDEKARTLLADCVETVRSRDFGETDVFVLLMLLRENEAPGGAIRDLADSCAHRTRDRGLVLKFSSMIAGMVASRSWPPDLEPAIAPTEFARQLNAAIVGLAGNPLAAEAAVDVFVMAMSLLQGVTLEEQRCGVLGPLEIGFSGEAIGLYASCNMPPVVVRVPLLLAPNRCHLYAELPLEGTTYFPPTIVRLRSRHASLEVF